MNKIILILSFLVVSYSTFGQNYKTIKTLKQQSKEIVVLATCDKYFATASYDKSIIVYDYDGNKVFKYLLSEGNINAMSFIPYSNLLLVAVNETDSQKVKGT